MRTCLTGMILLCTSMMTVAASQDEPAKSNPAKTGLPTKHPISGLDRIRIPVAAETFLMEIADDPTSRARGLGGRRTIPRNEGMLFAYPKRDVLGFWMKDCLTDIDIAYVSTDGRILSMHRMKRPPERRPDERIATYEARLPRYSSRHLVQFALEFAPGTLDRLGLEVGNRLDLPTERLIESAR
ncbi:MAG: hypothetical protein CMJ33_11260 [Phycisphaerae bacterium]|nr:hypothetical protein [Phycisphaerae bacterium]